MVRREAGGKIEVRDWVDSQNSFGATVRTDIVCYMQAKADSTASIENVELSPR
jgi:hypothetical protein